MLDLYAQGLSSNEIGERLGRDGRLVRTHVGDRLRQRTTAAHLARARGRGRTHRVNYVLLDSWSPEMAWLLGLIYGDGSICVREGEHYSVTLCGSLQVVKDASGLLKYCRDPVRMTEGCWYARWYSKDLVERLAKYGLEPGPKATTMTFPKVPEFMLGHFLRGLWDSDGHWKIEGGYISAVYVSASFDFIEGLACVLERAGFGPHLYQHRHIYKGKMRSSFHLSLPAEHTRKLARWIYNGSAPGVRCERKFQIVTGVIK